MFLPSPASFSGSTTAKGDDEWGEEEDGVLRVRELTAALSASRADATAARADWKADYPELVFATIPDENATGVEKRRRSRSKYGVKRPKAAKASA